MRGGMVVRGSAIGLALLLSVSVGCAKKEVVKSTDSGVAAPSQELSSGIKEGGIVTETMPPDTRMAGKEAETQTAMAARQAEAAAGAAATVEQPSRFEDIYFDYDKAFIREDAKPALAKVAAYLKGNPSASVRIEGHCDERGTAEYNIALGERRAEATRKYLASLGVRTGALSTVSFGKEKPVDPGHTEAAWAKNRRAHFVVK